MSQIWGDFGETYGPLNIMYSSGDYEAPCCRQVLAGLGRLCAAVLPVRGFDERGGGCISTKFSRASMKLCTSEAYTGAEF